MAAQHKRAGAKAKRERKQRAEARALDPLAAKREEKKVLEHQLAQAQARIIGLGDDEDSFFPEKTKALRRRLDAHCERLEGRLFCLKRQWGIR